MFLLQVVVATKSLFHLLWEAIISHWEITTVIFGAIGTGGTFLYKKIIKLRKWYFDMDSIRLQMPAINEKLEKIFSFIAPNGGNSISDKIDRIEKRGIVTQQLAWSMKEHSADGEFITNESGGWTRVNKTILKMISATQEDCKGDGWIGYLSNSCREATVEEYKDAIEQKRGTEIECAFKRDFAGIWYVVLSLQPMRNDGVIIGYTGTIKLKP